jgi:hypothetical protein
MYLPHISLDVLRISQVLDVSIKAELQHLRDSYFIWLLISSGAVALGILLEAPELAYEAVGIFKPRSTEPEYRTTLELPAERPAYTPPPEPKTPQWIATCAIVGWFLVLAGVGGEGIAEGFVASSDAKLQDFNEILTSELHRETDFALERASENEREAAQLRKDAEVEKSARVGLQGKVTEAGNRVEQLRKANNDAAIALEQEKQKRLELAASLLDREFNDQSGAIAKLSRFAPISVVFEYLPEREPTRLAEEINAVVSTAHWQSWGRHGNEWSIRDGVTISQGVTRPPPPSNPDERQRWVSLMQGQMAVTKDAADALREILQTDDIDAELGSGGYDLPIDTLLIRVGEKPNHVLENSIKELGGRKQPTPLGRVTMSGNRQSIPDGPPPNNKAK